MARPKPCRLQMEETVTALCLRDGFVFKGWKNTFENCHSLLVCECKAHGEWYPMWRNFVKLGSRCPGCAKNRRITDDEQIERILKICSFKNLKFKELKNGKISLECPVHLYTWWVSTRNFIHNGRGCPSCASSGYDASKPGYVYLLRSTSDNIAKVGISNNLPLRMQKLRNNTPFEFTLKNFLRYSDGKQAREIERMFHSQFESANLTGFDGSSEWLINYEAVYSKFKELL